MIARLRARRAKRQTAQDAAFVDAVAAEGMAPRFPVTRPSVSVWDQMVAEHGDPQIGTKRIRHVLANVHGAALAAPLRGER